MQRNFAAAIAQIVVFTLFCVIAAYSAVQVHDLQVLVLDGNRRVDELSTTVSRLRNELETGSLQIGAAAPAAAGGDQPYARRFFSDAQWEQLSRPGNYITFHTDRRSVPGAVEGGTIHRAAIADIPGLNPITQNAADVSDLYSYVTESLATRQRDDPDRWVSDLATRIEVNSDFTEYHVYLRDDVTWHPAAVDLTDPKYAWLRGERKMVADDFLFYYQLATDPQVDAAHLRNYFEKCTGLEVVNDHEFIVRWSEPLFTSISATLGLAPVPRWLYGADEDGQLYDAAEVGRRFNNHWYNQMAIGVGPYRFVRWVPGGAIELERYDGYYGEKPSIEKIEVVVMGDATARLNALRAGDVDYISVEPNQYATEIVGGGTPEFGEGGNLAYQTYQGTAYRYLGWNADGKYFNDRRVRLAMTHAFNRELILAQHFHGLGRLITGNFFVDGPDYDQSILPWPFDLERASQLLTEAGWVDGDGDGIREKVIDGVKTNFEFGMVTYGYRPEFGAAMEHYRNDLRSIGVVMNIEPVEWAVMVERMEEKEFDAYTGGWVLGWESDPYQIWHSSQADIPRSSNRVGFRNAEADRIIEEARATFDPAERTRLFHRFHAIIHEEQPYTFFFSGLEIGGWRRWVQNVNFSPLRPFDQNMNWYLEPHDAP
ncbi:MAG: hypothetical protein H6700_11905 [Myxococcales bacterium]|nr:hypothetical protein [Myxococcales bacterium]MCB9521050.1 hypothetical protein [Myxococcales bacterium]MCB9532460.1 hypothetical protein [Myxococcales bacterium]